MHCHTQSTTIHSQSIPTLVNRTGWCISWPTRQDIRSNWDGKKGL